MRTKISIFLLSFLFLCGTAWAQFTPLNYNTDVDDLGRGQKRYQCHTAHINYKDGEQFKKIDTTLTFNDTDKAWEQSKASYQCKIPEYADGEFDFYNGYEGAAHHIKAKPVAAHVKGILTNGAEDGNFVLYKDAFGKGTDLKVYAYHGGLKKVIIVNEKPVDISKDLTFDFELELPQAAKVLDKDGNEWDYSKVSAKLDFKDKTIRIGDSGTYSYFRNAFMWDSGKGFESVHLPVNIEMYYKNNKIYLRKTIPKAFLEKAVYPVMTDHPTSYYAGAGDGYVAMDVVIPGTWNDAITSATGTSVDYTTGDGAFAIVGYYTGSDYYCYRSFFPINTSGINDTDTITAASFYTRHSDTYYTGDGLGTAQGLNIFSASPASSTVLAVEDYDQVGTTTFSAEVKLANVSNTNYTNWALKSSGIANISKTGFTYFSERIGYDYKALSPSAFDSAYTYMWFSESTGTGNDPYLDVTTGGATPSGQIITVNVS